MHCCSISSRKVSGCDTVPKRSVAAEQTVKRASLSEVQSIAMLNCLCMLHNHACLGMKRFFFPTDN
jgi:hypothetical protein